MASDITISEAQIVAPPRTGVVPMPKVQQSNTSVLLRVDPADPSKMLTPTAADWIALLGTTISGGTLLIEGLKSGAGAIDVVAGAIGGGGTIAGSLMFSGSAARLILDPEQSLTVNGSLVSFAQPFGVATLHECVGCRISRRLWLGGSSIG